jgi:hypothetical protein
MTHFTTSSIPNWVVIEVDIVNYYDKLEYPNYDGKDNLMDSSIPNWVVIEVDIVNYYDKLEYPNYDGKDDLMDSMDPNRNIFSKDTTEEGNKVFLAAYAISLAIPNSRRLYREFCS